MRPKVPLETAQVIRSKYFAREATQLQLALAYAIAPSTVSRIISSADVRQYEIKPRTHCKRGHELSSDNLYISPAFDLKCRACQRIAELKYRERKAC